MKQWLNGFVDYWINGSRREAGWLADPSIHQSINPSIHFPAWPSRI
jgi:hypothetical protein